MKALIEEETVRTLFWLATGITMIVIVLGIIYFFGIKNLNIVVG